MALFQRIRNLFQRSRVDHDIASELEAHIELRMEENVAAGMTPEAARRDALLRFGNMTVARERVAGADMSLRLESILRDLRYAARQLRHAPGFAVIAILTLALGIGANVVVFGVLNALLLRPLHVAAPERLFELVNQHAGDDNQSYPDFVDFRARNSTFTDLATYRISFAGLNTGGTAARAWDYEVSSNYFDALGVQPQLGRLFHAADEHGVNSMPYIVLSDQLWRTRFNADPRVIGTTVELNKHPFTVIGVAPKQFNGTEIFFWPEFWMPIVNQQQVEGYNALDNRSAHSLFVVGALKPGVTPQQAADNLTSISAQLARENPAADAGTPVRLVKPGLMGDELGGPARPFLAATMALSLLVLLAACANLAGIFAARTADRTRELAIRLSIGSSRGRILRQLFTEAFLIALVGGVAGTVVALGMLRALSVWQPIAEFPIHVTVALDARVFAIALLLSVLSGMIPGLLPARQVWRTDAMQAMKGAARLRRRVMRFSARDLLLGFQIALCALLVTASLVAVRGMERSLHAPMGFRPQGATVVRMDMKLGGYKDDAAYLIQRRILDEAMRVPGVTAAGTVDQLPLGGSNDNWSVYREGTTDLRPANVALSAHAFIVSPGYFAAAQTTLVAGRGVSWDDTPKSPRVAVVNRGFARRLFGTEQAVGREFVMNGGACRVVGIVENGRYESLTEEDAVAMFFPLSQIHEGDTNLVVRSERSAADLAPVLKGMVSGIDSSLPVTIQPWSQALSLVLFPSRVATVALGVMGLLAAMLAVTGVFGLAAYSVSRRLRDLGIRVALGARRVQVMRSALARPVVLLLAGSAAGLLLGVGASRVIAALVYSATIRDPLVLAGALLTMMVIGVIATLVPARRALAVDPSRLLRED